MILTMAEKRFRYEWSRTWDDEAEDYVCADGDTKVGRVYRASSIAEGGWFWVCYAFINSRYGAGFGQVWTRDKACDLVEQCYEDLKVRLKALPAWWRSRGQLKSTTGNIRARFQSGS